MAEINLETKLQEAKASIKQRISVVPRLAVVLGSGLGGLVSEIEKEKEILFKDIPHVRTASVEGHVGKLVFGKWDGVPVVFLQGRLHFYEGYCMEDVVFPMRALAYFGVENFILTNAAGGLDTRYKPASIVLIKDHINLMGTNPLIGKNIDSLGPRFPDLTYLYDREIRKMIQKAAKEEKVRLLEGVYVGIHGPSFETPAEIKMYKKLGGNVVGMSTIPEAIALHHMDKRVAAISCVTNFAAGVLKQPLAHDEVLVNAKKAYPGFSKILKHTARLLGAGVVSSGSRI